MLVFCSVMACICHRGLTGVTANSSLSITQHLFSTLFALKDFLPNLPQERACQCYHCWRAYLGNRLMSFEASICHLIKAFVILHPSRAPSSEGAKSFICCNTQPQSEGCVLSRRTIFDRFALNENEG